VDTVDYFGLVSRASLCDGADFRSNAAKRLEQFWLGKALQISVYSRLAAEPRAPHHGLRLIPLPAFGLLSTGIRR
jgi:hypothetical protein